MAENERSWDDDLHQLLANIDAEKAARNIDFQMTSGVVGMWSKSESESRWQRIRAEELKIQRVMDDSGRSQDIIFAEPASPPVDAFTAYFLDFSGEYVPSYDMTFVIYETDFAYQPERGNEDDE